MLFIMQQLHTCLLFLAHMRFEGELIARVVSAVADHKNVAEDTLPPLYAAIEPDALEKLVEHTTAKPDAELLVRFSYAGHIVTIQPSGEILIEDGNSISNDGVGEFE